MIKILLTIILCLTLNGNFIEAKTHLKVGYVPDTAFLEEDRPGHLRGYGYEYMEFLAQYGDWEFEYVPCITWQECNDKLQAGLIDILPGMPGDYRALTNVMRTDHVIGRYPMQLVIHGDKPQPHMLIGTIPSNPPIPGLPQVAAEENFTYELINFPLFYDMEEAFYRHQLDGYISPMFEPNKKLGDDQTVLSIFDRQSYRLLLRTNQQDLLKQFNIAMDLMLLDQPNIRNVLNNKYLRQGGSPLILSKSERDYLAEKKKLTAALWRKEKPYAYFENGRLHGTIPSVIKQMSKDLNVEIELVNTNSINETMQLVDSGRIDFVADTTCDFSLGDIMQVAPTQPYLILEYIAVKRQNETLKEKPIIACIPEAPYTQSFIFPEYPEDQRLYCRNIQECFYAVSKGRADILYVPRSEYYYLIDETECYNLEPSSESDFSEEISLGIYSQADSRLWRIMNKEINHLDVSNIRSLEEVESGGSLTINWLLYHYPLRAMAIFLAFIGLIALGIWYRLRSRRKNIERMHQLAYTDSRYNLPNLIWFKRESALYFDQQKKSAVHYYVVSFVIEAARSELETQVNKIMMQLEKMDWVIISAVGEENGNVLAFTRARNSTEMFQLVREFIRSNDYASMNDSRIWFRIRAGIARVKSNYIQQYIDRAEIARELTPDDIKIFDDKMQEELEFNKKIESKMNQALKDHEFKAWYQPEYELETQKIIGAEVSIRWKNDELGYLLPERFVPLFEKNGFMLSVDYYMLERICEMERSRKKDGKDFLPVSITQTFLHMAEEDYLDKMKAIYSKHKLPRNLITIEFSERELFYRAKYNQREKVANVMRELQKLGFQISVKEFSADSSLHDLLGFLPVDIIKVDKKILESIDTSQRMQEILGSMIDLCKRLKIKIICSGIEKKTQEEILLSIGCEYGQGLLEFENGEVA